MFGVFIGVVVLKWGVLAERMVLPSWHCPVSFARCCLVGLGLIVGRAFSCSTLT